MVTISPPRRVGAIMTLKLASLVLRGSAALYRRRAIPRSVLQAALSATKILEQVGARLVLGRRRMTLPQLSNKEASHDRVD
jgi:hypothetical protein